MKLNISGKTKIYLLIIIGTLLIFLLGISFAFFITTSNLGEGSHLQITTEDTNKLIFTKGNDVNLKASLANFDSSTGNLVGETASRAQFLAKEGQIDSYKVYFYISKNNFVYTQNSTTPELILTITDPSGNVVTSIPGFTPTTVTDRVTNETITGFDITTYEGLITVSSDYTINGHSTGESNHDWKAKITFVNLDAEQTLNEGKNLESEFILQKEEFKYPVIDFIMNGYEISQIDPSDNSNISLSAKGLIHHNSNLTNGAGDNNYRYAGNNTVVTNNWVCFGSDEETCPEENVYRILGIYEGYIKLIKATYLDINQDGIIDTATDGLDGVLYGETLDVDYETSNLYSYLNNEFYNSFSSEYQNMIKTNIWNVGGNDSSSETAYEFYRDTIASPAVNKTVNNKIGLMYASDYGFAAYQDAWTIDLTAYHFTHIRNNNWLYDASSVLHEWLIAPHASYTEDVWMISIHGYLSNAKKTRKLVIRPVFYLEDYVKIISGAGTQSDPFILGIQ